ncbi:hypothetical protein J4Q44_G00258080 [Coregonus suidteri]|uniref:Sushi domain-containing protein n=1 Tax=Coregonus suidteri TaxID=861788 RepID=A0AAN8KY32_9TELE
MLRMRCAIGESFLAKKDEAWIIITHHNVYSLLSLSTSQHITDTTTATTTKTTTNQVRSCGSPGEVINGQYHLSGIVFGAKAVALCDTGYTLVGSGVRNCLVGGWDGRVPVCEVVKCGKPPTIVNGGPVIPPEDEYSYGSVVEYSCENDYTLVGTRSIACDKDGEFQPAPPECRMVSCPTPVVENGVRTEGRLPPYTHKSFVTYKCKDGYKMEGMASLTCEIEGWSAPDPICKDRVPGPGPPAARGHAGKIAGGVIGGLVCVCIIGFIIYKFKGRTKSYLL